MIAAVELDRIAQLVWASALAGIVVAVCFALLILGVARSADMRRAHRLAPATAYAALAALAGLSFAGGVVFSILVIVG